MSAQALIDRLHNVKLTGPNCWAAGCPLCQSRHGRPIAIRALNDGRTLVHAFCGCDTADVIAAVGLKWSDLFPPPPLNAVWNPPPRRLGFDPYQLLVTLSHELMVADLIASDVDASGEYHQEQRDRMQLAAVRISNALILAGLDRAVQSVRRAVRERVQ